MVWYIVESMSGFRLADVEGIQFGGLQVRRLWYRGVIVWPAGGLSVSPTELVFSSGGGSAEVLVYSRGGWYVVGSSGVSE